MPANNKPISKEDIARHPDHKIDEDFKGYPNGPANDETIKPATSEEKKTADAEKDGEKRIIKPDERKGLDEQELDGLANGF
ncbi:MAG: hypothetical protein ABIR30_11400 [Chitinophagaceae bacterium]